MRSKLLATFAVCAMVLATAPATAQTAVVPQFKTGAMFFHCLGDARLANPFAVEGKVPGWDASGPSESVADGGGCASQDPPQTQSGQVNPLDGVWRGTVVGNVRSMRVGVHAFPAIVPAGPITLGVRLVAQAESMFGGTASAPATRTITVTPVPANSGITSYVEFTILNLPFTTEDGFGTTPRMFELSLLNSTTDVQWVYDTTEVPSGFLYNAPSAGPVITASAP